MVVMVLWASTGYPMGAEAVPRALLISRFNVVLPYIPIKGTLAGFIGGGIVASVLYLYDVPQTPEGTDMKRQKGMKTPCKMKRSGQRSQGEEAI